MLVELQTLSLGNLENYMFMLQKYCMVQVNATYLNDLILHHLLLVYCL